MSAMMFNQLGARQLIYGCLPAAELQIGPRDIYLGTVHGVDVYEMRSHMDSHFRGGSFVVDVSPGLPVGFSLTPGNHLRFIVKDSDQLTTSASDLKVLSL
jgi:uncharacterized protein (DUF779 family)